MVGAAAIAMSAPEPEAAVDDDRWWLLAACREMDTELFFPDGGEPAPLAVLFACEHCLVRSDCLEHALRREDYGIWAGTSARQRKRLRAAAGIRLESPQSLVPLRALKATSDLPQVYSDDDEPEDDPWSWMK